MLERHELGVAELCDILQLPRSTVSRHLKVLADQGWVRSRGQGTTNLYRMLPDEIDPTARRLWALAREQTQAWATLRQDDLRLQRRLTDRETDSQAFFAGAAATPNRCQRLAQFVRDGEHQPDNEHGLYSDGGQHAHDLLPMIAPQIRLAKPDEAAGRQRAFGHAPSRVVVHRTRFA